MSKQRFNASLQGFTLIELLVAVAIFAIVMAIAVGSMVSLLNQKQHVETRLDELAQLQVLFAQMDRELAQVVNRPVRDNYGELVPALTTATALEQQAAVQQGITFTHQGRFVFDEYPESRLQRVTYMIEQGQLKRLVWPVLDRAEDTQPVEQLMLESVDNASFSFLSEDGSWQSSWADNYAITGTSVNALKLPLAIRVSLDTPSYGGITRIFYLKG